MAKFVPDINTKRWVVISPGRTNRPQEDKQRVEGCPFCEGNESVTPPEVWRVGGEGNWNKPGWKVRVVPNKYSITDIHEVIIHSPDDRKNIEDLPLDQVKLVLKVYRQRYQAHEKNGQILIFCNQGAHAGASLKHPHSQLVVGPNQLNLDSLFREPLNNLVEENKFFSVYCPDFSQWPYEVWLAPKEQYTGGPGNFKYSSFGETADEELDDLADILQKTLQKLKKISQTPKVRKMSADSEFSYNYYIYHGKGWYLRIIPRFIHRAGFELGTGLSVNVVDPADAAEELRIAALHS